MTSDTAAVPLEPSVAYGGELDQSVPTAERAAVSYSSRTTYVGAAEPVQLGGYDPNRQRLVVRNTHETLGVYVGTFGDVRASAGFLLPAGQQLEVWAQSEVWALLADTAAAPPIAVSVWIESSR